MRLKAIYDTQENQEYIDILNNLREKFGKGEHKYLSVGSICEGDYQVEHRYGTNVYKGKLKPDIEITELELSMMCDNGFSYFGGSSNIDSNNNFKVEIWFD